MRGLLKVIANETDHEAHKKKVHKNQNTKGKQCMFGKYRIDRKVKFIAYFFNGFQFYMPLVMISDHFQVGRQTIVQRLKKKKSMDEVMGVKKIERKKYVERKSWL